jgi:phosphoribosylamine---glycine ligase
MRVLVVGSGGREHSLVWRLSSSKNVDYLICAPGNPGIKELAQCFAIAADDIEGLIKLALDEKIDLVVVGPEIPLSKGLADKLRALNIATFGPSQAAAQLESSKAFSKDFMARNNIPTARFGVFTDIENASEFIMSLSAPYVLKASGLAAGKGVVIAPDLPSALTELDEMFGGKFGDASSQIVIEEFMHGEEASFFVLCNSQSAIALPVCQDHKRAFDNDLGPNTGGMGAYAPASLVDEKVHELVMNEIVLPTIAGMKNEGNPYNGVLYVGLMIENNIPRVVEYNCRFGDPECQILMQFLGDDFAQCLMDIANEKPAKLMINQEIQSAVTVVMAANGYPDAYYKDGQIDGIENAQIDKNVFVFHAGTKTDANGKLLANGGRVLNVTAQGIDLQNSLASVYTAIEKINAPSLFYRKDIGQKELKRQGL